MKNEWGKLSIVFVIMVFSGLLCFNVVSAQEVNYSTDSSYGGIQVSSLKYEPYPANPGEYVDVWIKAKIGSLVDYAKFEVIDSFPFTVDSSENPIREYKDFSGDVVMHYKVRIDKDAVEGANQLKIKIYSGSSSGSVYSIDINIADAQTDFDLVIQDSTSSEISLAIANIGKNTANSMIVRIPDQESYKVSGTNGQMVGNLESGDYTITSFSLTSVGRNPGNLIVQIDYTDSIGERRSVLKEVKFGSSQSSGNISAGYPTGTRNFPGGTFPGMQTKKSKWPYFLAGGLLLLIIGFFLYQKYKTQVKLSSKNEKKNTSKDTEIPEWIRKVNEKERK